MRMETAIETFVSANSQWSVENNLLRGEFHLQDFAAVKQCVEMIMALADEINHHPTITFGYKTIIIETTTHDAGNTITELDLEFAQRFTDGLSTVG